MFCKNHVIKFPNPTLPKNKKKNNKNPPPIYVKKTIKKECKRMSNMTASCQYRYRV